MYWDHSAFRKNVENTCFYFILFPLFSSRDAAKKWWVINFLERFGGGGGKYGVLIKCMILTESFIYTDFYPKKYMCPVSVKWVLRPFQWPFWVMHAFCIIILVIIFLILDKLGIVCLKGSCIYKQLIIITHYTERKKEMKKWRKKIALF